MMLVRAFLALEMKRFPLTFGMTEQVWSLPRKLQKQQEEEEVPDCPSRPRGRQKGRLGKKLLLWPGLVCPDHLLAPVML